MSQYLLGKPYSSNIPTHGITVGYLINKYPSPGQLSLFVFFSTAKYSSVLETEPYYSLSTEWTEWAERTGHMVQVPVQRNLPWCTWILRAPPWRRSAAGPGSGSGPCGASSCPTRCFWCPLTKGLSSCPSGQDRMTGWTPCSLSCVCLEENVNLTHC